jgi:branched-chain amino acid transport system substrate-binding protein
MDPEEKECHGMKPIEHNRGGGDMKVFKILALGIITCVLMAVIIGVGPGSDRVRAEEPVKIGVLVPLTGASAFGGNKELIGIQIAIDEINQAGGVLGRKLEIIVEDTESRPKGAMDGIHKLVDVNNVPLVIGCHNSSSTIPSATYAQSREVNQISIASTSPDIRKIGPYHFAACATDEVMGAELVKLAMKDTGKKEFGILVMNDAYGAGLGNVIRKVIAAEGGKVLSEVKYELNKSDYRAELQRLFAPKPPIILSVAWAEMSRVIQKQAYELGLFETVKDTWYSAYFADSVEAAIPETIEGRKGLDIASPKGEQFAEFQAKYAAHTKDKNEIVSWYQAAAYDAARIAALAIEMAGSTDSNAINKALPEAFKTYQGVSNPDMSVDEDGVQKTQIFQSYVFRNGKVEVYDIK